MSLDYHGYSYLSTGTVYELEDQMSIDDLRRFNRGFQDVKMSTQFIKSLEASQQRLKNLLAKYGSKFKMFYYAMYFAVDHYNKISIDAYCVDYEYKKDLSILDTEKEIIQHLIDELPFQYQEPDYDTGESRDEYSQTQFLDLFLDGDEEELKGNVEYLKVSPILIITNMQRWIDDSIEAEEFMNFCPDD